MASFTVEVPDLGQNVIKYSDTNNYLFRTKGKILISVLESLRIEHACIQTKVNSFGSLVIKVTTSSHKIARQNMCFQCGVSSASCRITST